ncbi:hypothetical protein [Methylobacterium sp. SI9]|jgi:hypothetical protein|uniref:hypothetical protein n=1 Tax=Methylobacterium guangdongense TaxID=3138811 RepID=UPI00313CE2BD
MTRIVGLLILGVLATGAAAQNELACETVRLDSGSCRQDETGAPAFEPSADGPSWWAGWR